MTEITDEMVTAALVALFRNGWRTSPLAMRDALSAVAPMIAAQERERCARVLEAEGHHIAATTIRQEPSHE